ncbi:hypothetical protein BX600DRAFT_472377 [Xylariales sp. PMI_506]|nr:hypothetical protein BX600DRAFT_472377 [Xylariales sp. PMI_506]
MPCESIVALLFLFSLLLPPSPSLPNPFPGFHPLGSQLWLHLQLRRGRSALKNDPVVGSESWRSMQKAIPDAFENPHTRHSGFH